MLKMSAFSVDTDRQTTPPLVDGVRFTTDWSSSNHKVRCAHKSGDVINFIIVACRISSRLKWYKNYKNRLRLAKVIVRNKMSRFLWFTVYKVITELKEYRARFVPVHHSHKIQAFWWRKLQNGGRFLWVINNHIIFFVMDALAPKHPRSRRLWMEP